MSCSASAREPYGSLMWTMCSCIERGAEAQPHSVLPSCQMLSPPEWCTYLHGESLSVDGVLRSRSPIPSPVEVELGRSVVAGESSSRQSDRLWQVEVSCGGEKLSLHTDAEACSHSRDFPQGEHNRNTPPEEPGSKLKMPDKMQEALKHLTSPYALENLTGCYHGYHLHTCWSITFPLPEAK